MDTYYSITGKPRPAYADIIQATAPQALQAELDRRAAAVDQGFLDLDEKSLEQAKKEFEAQLALQQEQMSANKRQGDISTGIGATDLGLRAAPYLKSGYNAAKEMLVGDKMDLPTTVNPGPAVPSDIYTNPVDEYISNNAIDLSPGADGVYAPAYSTTVPTPTYEQAPVPYQKPTGYENPVDIYTADNPVSVDLPAIDMNLPGQGLSGLTSVAAPEVPMSFNDGFWGADAVSRFGQTPATVSMPEITSLGGAGAAGGAGMVGQQLEAGAQAAGNTTVAGASAVPSSISTALPYVGAALQLYNILDTHYGKRDPIAYGAQQILEASEGKKKLTGGYDPTIIEQGGEKYLYDPVYKERTGQDAYHPLTTDYLDKMRGVYGRGEGRKAFGFQNPAIDQSAREELMTATPGFGRDQDARTNALGGIRRDFEGLNSTGFKGMSSDAIRSGFGGLKTRYDELNKNGSLNGLG